MNAPATSAAPAAVGHSGDHAALIQTLHAIVGPDQLLRLNPEVANQGAQILRAQSCIKALGHERADD